MGRITEKVSMKVDLNADSVEWCPLPELGHLFTCGTYQLSEEENRKEERDATLLRRGILYLYQLCSGGVVKELQRLEMPGILDCKWAPRRISSKVFLAVANAIGELKIFSLKEEDSVSLEFSFTHKVCERSSTLALTLDWSNALIEDSPRILVGDSEGSVTTLVFTESSLTQESQWKLHDFQAWVVAFDYWNPSVSYSGGDDCCLYIHDRRCEKFVKNMKAHSAGVTSMHSNAKHENVFVSGSYDETLVKWDTRQMSQQGVGQTTLPGGVWRLKWEPQECRLLAAAIMHGGFAVVDGLGLKSLGDHQGSHSSIGYGIDWSPLPSDGVSSLSGDDTPSGKVHLLAMCSFYDNFLSLATFEEKE